MSGAATDLPLPAVFTVEQRAALRERMLRLADEDEHVVAGAAVGSLAVGAGDAFSDLDLTFAIDDAPVVDVLDDWTRTLVRELDAVRLVDLEAGSTIYRVFLLADALQFDLSMTPAAEFRAAGPKFQLLFGVTAPGEPEPRSPKDGSVFIRTPPVAQDIFGWGVIYGLHARACIERARVWQARHYVDAVRDHGLALACLRHGVTVVQARGYDDLPAETLARFDGTHVGSLGPDALRRALGASVAALLAEAADANLPDAAVVAERLAELRQRPLVDRP
jgi:hypothetical protein